MSSVRGRLLTPSDMVRDLGRLTFIYVVKHEFVPHRKRSVLRLEIHDISCCSFIYSSRSPSYDKSVDPAIRVPHGGRFNSSSFNFQYRLCSFRSSSSPLYLLPRLLLTSILPSIFPSITCFKRQFLLKM